MNNLNKNRTILRQEVSVQIYKRQGFILYDLNLSKDMFKYLIFKFKILHPLINFSQLNFVV